MKRTKIVFGFVLSFVFAMSSCVAAYADTSIDEIIPNQKTQTSTYQFNEFSTLINLKLQSVSSSTDLALTKTKVNQMESDVRNELSRRTKLSDETLTKMGYNSSDIDVLRTLTGNESLAELAQTRALFSSVTCKRSLDSYI